MPSLKPTEARRIARRAPLGVFIGVWLLVAVITGLAIGVLLSVT